MSMIDLLQILPAAFLALWAVVIVLVDLWIPEKRKSITVLLAAVGLAISLGVSISQRVQVEPAFQGMVMADQLAVFFNAFFAAAGLLSVGLAFDYLKRTENNHTEFYPLLLISVSGMMLMASASHLLMVFLALEMFSIPLYVLSAFNIRKSSSAEAGLKYFLLGAFASGFLLFGIALTFGATGTMQFTEIANIIKTGAANDVYLLLGGALMMIGLAFKIAVVPFHMWVPDVYEGAPTPTVAFMAVGTKAAGFVVLIRLFSSVFPLDILQFSTVFWVLSALTMVVGNVLALLQKNIKRMLAYSSIAHAGYMLMVLTVFSQPNLIQDGISSIVVYLMVYGIASFGTWSVVAQLERKNDEGLMLEDYAGLWKTAPAMALAMLFFMLSFTGMPLTIGLVGKLFLFRTAIAGGFGVLAVIGALASLVSAFYYMRVVMIMFMQPGEPKLSVDIWPKLIALVAALLIGGLSIFPQYLINLSGL
ncbi:MAG: NADH-quinone oxidoreductase subunit N [Anaerolineaceae bacterium]|nr:NADH-quinone oxidoreductase subunit N [Anaerolineaceae bacterium]